MPLCRKRVFIVNLAAGLSGISVESVAKHMQVSESNPMDGLEGRSSLLINLGLALKKCPELFGEDARPGNMLGASTFELFTQVHLTHKRYTSRFPPEGVERKGRD